MSFQTHCGCAPRRFAELRQSLQLFRFDLNIKLHPPRAQRPVSERDFASSNYRNLLLALKTKEKDLSNWAIFRAVEELIKIHAPKNWASSFVNEVDQSKKHDSSDVGATAQYLCECVDGITQGHRHGLQDEATTCPHVPQIVTTLCVMCTRVQREETQWHGIMQYSQPRDSRR